MGYQVLPQSHSQFFSLSSELNQRLDLTDSRLSKLKDFLADEGDGLFNKNGSKISELTNLISTDIQEYKMQLERL